MDINDAFDRAITSGLVKTARLMLPNIKLLSSSDKKNLLEEIDRLLNETDLGGKAHVLASATPSGVVDTKGIISGYAFSKTLKYKGRFKSIMNKATDEELIIYLGYLLDTVEKWEVLTDDENIQFGSRYQRHLELKEVATDPVQDLTQKTYHLLLTGNKEEFCNILEHFNKDIHFPALHDKLVKLFSIDSSYPDFDYKAKNMKELIRELMHKEGKVNPNRIAALLNMEPAPGVTRTKSFVIHLMEICIALNGSDLLSRLAIINAEGRLPQEVKIF